MIDNSNKSKKVEGSQIISSASGSSSSSRIHLLFGSIDTLIPMGAAALQIMTGLALISLSILGLITPYWFSAILSIAGSVSCMAGVFLIYHTSAKKGSLDSLINQAIRRVIESQN